MTEQQLEDLIFNYRTKYEQGFTSIEMLEVIDTLGLDRAKVFEEIGVNTCMMLEGYMITYHTDFYKGLRNVMFDKKTSVQEWD